tara:strand:- start:159 stop:638 length:480 start_codon:yes stop_codon:yes gene_type:complete
LIIFLFLIIKKIIVIIQKISFKYINLKYTNKLRRLPKKTPRKTPIASEVLTKAYALGVGNGEHKYGTAISAAGQYIPAAAPIRDWPNRYKKVSFAINKKKLAKILKNDEINKGSSIFLFLLRYFPEISLVIVPKIAENVKPSPIWVADNPILLNIRDVK